MRKSVLAAVLVLLAAGCGDDDDGTRTASCNIEGLGTCFTVTGPSGDMAGFEQQCQSGFDQGFPGSVVSSCSATNRVGRCSLPVQGGSIVEHFYSPTWGPPTGADAQSFCVTMLGGTWQPG
jgi:hypothetical protein